MYVRKSLLLFLSVHPNLLHTARRSREPVQRGEGLEACQTSPRSPSSQRLCGTDARSMDCPQALPFTNSMTLHRLLLEATFYSFAKMSNDDLIFPGYGPAVQA